MLSKACAVDGGERKGAEPPIEKTQTMIQPERIVFFVVVNVVAILAGMYTAPLGIDWLIGELFYITVLAIEWMRTYW
jgi:hypothetical protein